MHHERLVALSMNAERFTYSYQQYHAPPPLLEERIHCPDCGGESWRCGYKYPLRSVEYRVQRRRCKNPKCKREFQEVVFSDDLFSHC